MRVLLLATTTGYQTRAFGEAAERLGIELVLATDRCHMLEDPWRDNAIPIRFYDEQGSAAAVIEAVCARPIDGILVVGDRPTVIAARVAEALGLPGHPPDAAGIARNKLLTRNRLRETGLPVPSFFAVPVRANPEEIASLASYPSVVKPISLSGSRGVIRADDRASFVAAFERLRSILALPDIRAERNVAHETVLVEDFLEGREYALEGLLHHGSLEVLAIFDKPDPLDGPYFEETLYVTPSSAPVAIQETIVGAAERVVASIGLRHGPIHAECRVNENGVFVLEVAARPIGGLCARALRFHRKNSRQLMSLEELLLRHGLGDSPDLYEREPSPSGVMMIPIPRRGIYRRVEGLNEARAINGIDDVQITAKPDQVLIPLPEGASYLGFIFAHGSRLASVEHALRAAHVRLQFTLDSDLPVLQFLHG